MNTLELKNLLKLRIDYINDKKFLTALQILQESKTENIIILSKEQKEEIEKSKLEYLEENYFINNSVNEEINEYLGVTKSMLNRNQEILESYNLDLKNSEKDISDGKVYTQDQVAEKIAQWKKR